MRRAAQQPAISAADPPGPHRAAALACRAAPLLMFMHCAHQHIHALPHMHATPSFTHKHTQAHRETASPPSFSPYNTLNTAGFQCNCKLRHPPAAWR